jgi:hypothetical protein
LEPVGADAARAIRYGQARVNMGENAEAQIAPGFGLPIRRQRRQERSEGCGAGAEEKISASHGVLVPMDSIRDREAKRDFAMPCGGTRSRTSVLNDKSRE